MSFSRGTAGKNNRLFR